MIALTGGAGAMGLRLAAELRRRGLPVAILDLARDEFRQRAESVGAAFRPCDITRPDTLGPALAGATSVVHLAAILLADEDALRLEAINVDGTRHVLAQAAAAGVSRFVHISSISVLYQRQNAYSRSKRSAEELVRATPLAWTILRPSLAWGDPGAAEFALFERAAARWPILPLPAGGRARKAPVHVDDLALAFVETLADPTTIRHELDLHGPRTLSLAEMAREIRAARSRIAITLPVPLALATFYAKRLAPLVRRSGLPPKLDWQTLTGLLEDAAPEPAKPSPLPRWNPRPWKASP